LLAACSDGNPRQHLSQAEAALAAGNHAKAVASADEGLTRKPEAAVRWRLELIRLEALARSGRADAAVQAIERLAGTGNSPVTASHYLSTADQLRGAGNQAGAIQLLDKGAKRFPGDADIAQAIARAKESGSSEELDTLRSLGYLD
jgi:tetratricopeptide (TPR) repeat protein